MPPNSDRPGSNCAKSAWPPSARDFSHKITSCPRLAATAAAFMPPTPPPITITRRGCLRGAMMSVPELAAGHRVLNAGDPVMRETMTDTGLVAADAGPDVVAPALPRLGREIGVADQRPCHAHHIGIAVVQNLFGGLRLVDPSGDKNRNRYRLLLWCAPAARHRHGPVAMGGKTWTHPPGDADDPAMTLT